MPVDLTSKERARLKARAHALSPVIRIGHAGVTPELLAEVNRALKAHGLIKVRVDHADRDERVALGEALCAGSDAAPVHRVGKVLIMWRPKPQDDNDDGE